MNIAKNYLFGIFWVLPTLRKTIWRVSNIINIAKNYLFGIFWVLPTFRKTIWRVSNIIANNYLFGFLCLRSQFVVVSFRLFGF